MVLCLRVTKSPENEIGFSHYKEFSNQGGVVGRSERCDWWLPDRSNIISNQHMFIRYQDNQFYIVDNSTNGTSLGHEEKDALIPGKPYSLSEGSEIAIGEYILHVEKVINNQEKEEKNSNASAASLHSHLEGELPFLNPHAETDLERLVQNEQHEQTHTQQPQTQRFENKFNAWTNPTPAFQAQTETPPPQPARFDPFEAATLGQSQDTESSAAIDTGKHETAQSQPQKFNHFQQDTQATPAAEPTPFTGFQHQQSQGRIQHPSSTPTHQTPALKPQSTQPPPQSTLTQTTHTTNQKSATQQQFSQSNFLDSLVQRFGLSQDAIYALGEEQVTSIVMDLLEGSLEGFIELLIARAKVKNDLNVNMTMIQHEENNILKHSVHAKQAMALFLQTQSDSFLAAKPAIEDTVKDIKQHQRALFEAVKKALQSTLNAVDPLAIERQASEGKRYFFPGNKYKADCWKDYSKRFQNLQRNDGALLYEQFLDYFADTYQEKTQS